MGFVDSRAGQVLASGQLAAEQSGNSLGIVARIC